MPDGSSLRLQLSVFALVSAAFTNIYITQPVLPVLQTEFGTDMVTASFSVSAVILGIALLNLPFGFLADRLPIRPIILTGGVAVAAGGLICAVTYQFWLLIAARFMQGCFVPALTTCLAAYLAKTLPAERLNVVMGSYVSATVLGGLGSRLLGGLIHPPLHWRYAFVSAAALTLFAVWSALKGLPHIDRDHSAQASRQRQSYWSLLKRWELLRIYLCAAGAFAVFSSLFNYLPFRLAGPPFGLSTEATTLLYLVYIMGIFMGPIAGQMSNRFGGGTTLVGGAIIFGASILIVRGDTIAAVIFGLIGICTGFFAVHAAAVGALNRKLTEGQGQANALYVLFYYVGGWIGIGGIGLTYKHGGWNSVVYTCLAVLIIPLMAGILERRSKS